MILLHCLDACGGPLDVLFFVCPGLLFLLFFRPCVWSGHCPWTHTNFFILLVLHQNKPLYACVNAIYIYFYEHPQLSNKVGMTIFNRLILPFYGF